MIEQDFGYIKIKVNEQIEKKGISKNKLTHRAEMQRTLLKQYCEGGITRLDTAVLARLCTVLDCRIEDILEFVPADKNK